MSSITVSLDEIEAKSIQALTAHGAKHWIAEHVSAAIRRAEATGNLVCGLFYLESYCTQLKTGRVDGTVEPEVSQPKPATVLVNAKFGFAQSAFSSGINTAIESAKTNGNCTLAIAHSHTCTAMSFFTSKIAEAGLIGIGMTNAPACVSPPGGNEAVLGTNPIAMSVPAKQGGIAFEFDQSTSAIAIGKIRMAAAAGEKIPFGWAIDKNGEATDDPDAALQGSLISAGGYKGYGFGLMAEVLAAAVTGSINSVNCSALKTAEGPPHDLGQFYFLLDPTCFSEEQFWQRMETLNQAIQKQGNARLPGSERIWPKQVSVDQSLWQTVLQLATE